MAAGGLGGGCCCYCGRAAGRGGRGCARSLLSAASRGGRRGRRPPVVGVSAAAAGAVVGGAASRWSGCPLRRRRPLACPASRIVTQRQRYYPPETLLQCSVPFSFLSTSPYRHRFRFRLSEARTSPNTSALSLLSRRSIVSPLAPPRSGPRTSCRCPSTSSIRVGTMTMIVPAICRLRAQLRTTERP